MSLTWPWALVGLLLVPVLVTAYGRVLRRRRDQRASLAARGLVVVRPTRERARHLAPALLIAALAVMLLALTRPVAAVAEPHREGTVVLAFDVSTSMGATDGDPTRLDSAKEAAAAFVQRQPADVKVGVVAFGGTALVTQQPTTDKDAVTAAIGRLRPEGETSLGRGIVAALGAIAGKPIAGAETATATTGPTAGGGTADGGAGGSLDGVDIGYYGGTAIVLLTDGENTGGPEPAEAADLASVAGVKIYPIGLGSAQGTTLEVDGFTLSTALDEPVLEQVAETTGGTYANAPDAASLASVYDSIELKWTTRTAPHEVTSWVAGLGLLLLLAGATVSVLRSGRVV